MSSTLDRGILCRAETGELAAGTVDSLLIWHLTGGERHVTDGTNASRTLLMDLRTLTWAVDLCSFFGVPRGILPEIRPSAGEFGRTKGLDYLPDGLPITGVAGDQQASLVGQGCLSAGQAKCTYGTGAFLLAHTGETVVPSTGGLITTLAATLGDGPPQYALESCPERASDCAPETVRNCTGAPLRHGDERVTVEVRRSLRVVIW